MKRKRIKGIKSIWKIFPILFWRQCVVCNEEFRMEFGWMDIINLNEFCRECCSTKIDVLNVHEFLKKARVKNRPGLKLVAPPPPPPKIIRKVRIWK